MNSCILVSVRQLECSSHEVGHGQVVSIRQLVAAEKMKGDSFVKQSEMTVQFVKCCVCLCVHAEFPVDEPSSAGCGQHSPSGCLLPGPRPSQLPAQGTHRLLPAGNQHISMNVCASPLSFCHWIGENS